MVQQAPENLRLGEVCVSDAKKKERYWPVFSSRQAIRHATTPDHLSLRLPIKYAWLVLGYGRQSLLPWNTTRSSLIGLWKRSWSCSSWILCCQTMRMNLSARHAWSLWTVSTNAWIRRASEIYCMRYRTLLLRHQFRSVFWCAAVEKTISLPCSVPPRWTVCYSKSSWTMNIVQWMILNFICETSSSKFERPTSSKRRSLLPGRVKINSISSSTSHLDSLSMQQ